MVDKKATLTSDSFIISYDFVRGCLERKSQNEQLQNEWENLSL